MTADDETADDETADDETADDETTGDETANGAAGRDGGVSGRRVAELLASELTARDDGSLSGLTLADVDRGVEPDEFGALAYRVRIAAEDEGGSGGGDGGGGGVGDGHGDGNGAEDGGGDGAAEGATVDDGAHVADCFVHEERVRLEFAVGLDRVPELADEAGLRVRPKAVEPPRALVFVEDTAQVKRVLPVVGAVADDVRDSCGTPPG